METLLLILLDWFGGAIVSLPLVMLMMSWIDRKRFSKNGDGSYYLSYT